MMQLPTGGGKTRIAGALLSDWLANGSKAVWLTHRKELSEQTRDSLIDDGVWAMADVAWTSGSDAPAMPSGVMILMAQTVGRRTERRDVWARYGARDLMGIDEAHHATAPGWERAIEQWHGPVRGVTATPWRLSTTEGFDHLFSGLICGQQTGVLRKNGHLYPSRMVWPHPEQRILGGKIGVTGGGYDFGKSCGRCGKWRPWARWHYEERCGNAHDFVCDRCHVDAQMSLIKRSKLFVEVCGEDVARFKVRLK